MVSFLFVCKKVMKIDLEMLYYSEKIFIFAATIVKWMSWKQYSAGGLPGFITDLQPIDLKSHSIVCMLFVCRCNCSSCIVWQSKFWGSCTSINSCKLSGFTSFGGGLCLCWDGGSFKSFHFWFNVFIVLLLWCMDFAFLIILVTLDYNVHLQMMESLVHLKCCF